ncbi:DUF6385 domain-containing protein [Oscillospiraceae bacterium MB08-C2-2]|nr:DUF6385 domain-containing protein [Oscillospiraceae bacterium MB08-C2-2]
MENEISISTIRSNQDLHLLYFDSNHIENPSKIDKAYLLNAYKKNPDSEVEVVLNEYLTHEDAVLIDELIKKPRYSSDASNILCDITEAVQTLSYGSVENKGLLVKFNGFIYKPRILLFYRKEIIYPRCGCEIFFEKELELHGFAHRAQSPWFYSGRSQTITFFVENLGSREINIHLENSPNANSVVVDPQCLCVKPGQTVDIVPYRFSKFIRLASVSDDNRIVCNLWFQTQLMND